MRNLFYILVVFLSACAGEDLKPSELISWVEAGDNGLCVKKAMGDIEYTVQYRPIQYIVALEGKTDKLKEEDRLKKVHELDGMQYFSLRLKRKDKNQDVLMYRVASQQEYLDRTTYASFDMQYDMSLVEGQDTLTTKLFHYVRNYGVAPYVDFVFAFDLREKRGQTKTDKTFVFEDKIYGNGTLKFHIDKNSINSIPELNTI